ncbi:FAD synthetase family protein [Lysinibacillus sp. BW-2-10]|uniref:FAD synthetase family protein n=1 Tax=Lysinibacillus sp. BW-2-10 TaxID=2590030 RepID=UPI00117EFBE2|nr:FAD synthetase family protein [Lysinibacillus sp. BW-2-10]TSI08990.1 FAD synthetase family protein [Lysinibacillus sp. BW-2-10]
MKTIKINSTNLNDWKNKLPKHVIALGFFDGLHKGHQQVILKAKETAIQQNLPLSVMSFFPHPKSVLSKGQANVDYLMPLSEKEKQLEAMGVDHFFIVEFSLDFASLSPEQFVSDYLIDLGSVHAVCGFDYTYGQKGAGNITTLAEHGKGLLEVSVVPKVNLCGDKISSTRIRELLAQGEMMFISELLGKPYQVEWDAKTGLYPFYTLPTLGFYEVILSRNGRTQQGIISVLNNQNIDFGEMHIPTTGSFTITWLREVRIDNYKAIS